MKLNKTWRIVVFLLLIVINIGCDQITKSIVRENVKYNAHIQLVGNNFILTKVQNTGAFLSLGSTLNPVLRDILLLAFPAFIIAVLLVWVFIKNKLRMDILIGLSFIIGGGIGNIADRILYGSVTDFLHINLGGIFRTGIFNMADVSVMVGMFLLLIGSYIKKGKSDKIPAEQSKNDSL
ncbi:lipoprotein signal peptidase [bacterium BMS3Abin04]|nr:lipoprotein signal peptidase [bacterium BMS3Abin04]